MGLGRVVLFGLFLAFPPPAFADLGDESKTSSVATSTATILFVKGDLIYPGTRELLSRYDHGGVRLGPHILGRDIYLGVDPGFAYYPGDWAFSLHVPLNLLLVDTKTREFGGFAIREQDWDELSDFARIIRFVTFGRRESPIYFTISSLRPQTLGHGQLILDYQQNIDVDRSMTGVAFDAYNGWVGTQLKVNDVTFDNRLFGALGFVKPLAFVDDDLLRSLSLGVEYSGDLKAPRCIQVSSNDRRCVPGSGNRAGPDPQTGANRDDTFVRSDPDLGRPVIDETDLHAIGFSGEMRYFKSARADAKGYLTWHQFLGHGDGLALGTIARITAGQTDIHAFRLRLEYRTFAADFLPGYFDTLYEVQKYQYVQSGSSHQATPTKYQAIFGDQENGYTLADPDRRHGFRLETSWAFFGKSRSNKLISFGLGLEDSTGPSDTKFYAHVEVPFLRAVQLFGTFMRQNGDGIGDIFTGPIDNVVVLSGLRLQVLPILFVNAHYSRSFQIIRGPGREFHLGNGLILGENGQPSRLFASDRLFDNVQTLFVELELGLEIRS